MCLWGFGGVTSPLCVVWGLEWGLILCVVFWGLFSGVWGESGGLLECYLVVGFVLRVYLAIGSGESGILCGALSCVGFVCRVYLVVEIGGWIIKCRFLETVFVGLGEVMSYVGVFGI